MKNKSINVTVTLVFFCVLVFLTGCTRKIERADGLDEIVVYDEDILQDNVPEAGYDDWDGETDTGGEIGNAGAGNVGMGLAETEAALSSEELCGQPCYVYICGAVQLPGVYEMEPDDRIFTVIERAGGFTEGACTDYVNQALSVADGLRIWIPTVQEAEELAGSRGRDSRTLSEDSNGLEYPKGMTDIPDAKENEASGGLVNINTAAKEQLCTLTGIGERKAEAIIAYRMEHGNFSQKEDIMKVAGIKQGGYDKIKEQITEN